jgi:C4-dicarboxylate transporter, DctQ subunit
MFLRWINRAEEIIIELLLVGITLIVFMDVVLRFGFDTGFIWSEELTLHLCAWLVLFGASYGLKVGAHIGVDALVRLLPVWGRRLATGLAVLLGLVYCGLFLYGSWVYLAKVKEIGLELEDLPIPVWIAHGILVIGMVLLAIRLLELLWAVGWRGATGFHRVDEAEESMHMARDLARGGEAP